MASLAEKLHRWSVQELNLASEGGDVPDVESFKLLTEGKNKRMWTYVINHVRSKATVNEVKRTLRLKKLLQEKKDNVASFNDVNADVIKLETAVSRINEKGAFLTRTLSTIEERILSVEQTIESINEETAEINQKSAFLQLLRKKYDDKSELLKILSSQILSHMDYLRSYESSRMVSNQSDFSSSYGFLYDKSGTDFKLKQLYSASFAIVKMKLTQNVENELIILENLQKQNCELKKTGFCLTDLVIFLKNMSDFDMQEFFTSSSQSVSVEDFMSSACQKNPAKQLLSRINYENVKEALCVARNEKERDQLLVVQDQVFKDKIENLKINLDYDVFDIKVTLFRKLAENGALVTSNNYLEENIKNISSKAEEIKPSCENNCQDETSSLLQRFYKNADVAFYLSNMFPDVFQKILNDFSKLQSFAHNELFVPRSYLSEHHLADMSASLVSDRKLMWEYCKITNIIEPLYSKPYNIDYPLSSDVRKLLFIQPFENVCTICRKWISFKNTLKSEALSGAQSHVLCAGVSTSEMDAEFMKMLDEGKFLIEKGMSSINGELVLYSNKNKILIQEWWEQNAQFIPSIEYEGKTLKLWIDILGTLTEFEQA